MLGRGFGGRLGGGRLVRSSSQGPVRRCFASKGREEAGGGGGGEWGGEWGWAAGGAGTLAALAWAAQERLPVARALRHRDLDLDDLEEMDEVAREKARRELTPRERRFLRFASLESTGTIYMTPRDFLDSVTQEHPRQRIRRQEASEAQIQQWLKKTPAAKRASPRLFRELDSRGLISFAEYLFLLSVLTKPRSGFDIAFQMFDMDGNRRVDKKEFLVIRALLTALRRTGKAFRPSEHLENEEALSPALLAAATKLEGLQPRQPPLTKLEEILSRGREGRDGGLASDDEQSRRRQDSAQPSPAEVEELEAVPDTTLLVHFFGRGGDRDLSYDDFSRFYDNLQTEVLELEFAEFSRGKATITESDFARILLRYTLVHIDDYQAYMERIAARIPQERGISLEQFQYFCKFLNHMDDFAIAMRMFSIADIPISKKEFARAVQVSTGFGLEDHLIETVFTIFDVNNDGSLSYSEFIAVMKDRLHRGFRSQTTRQGSGWDAFKACVREEVRAH